MGDDSISPAQWMRQLCRSSARWRTQEGEVFANRLFYVDVAKFADDLVDNARGGRNSEDSSRAFACVEQGLLHGDDATQDLIVTGLFEALQWRAYAGLEPPDALSKWLGPRSLRTWGDLIEGWTGRGIRTIEHWRRVLVNGPYAWVEWIGPREHHRWDRNAADDVTLSMPESVGAGFCPLVADRLDHPDRALALGCDGRYRVRVGRGSSQGYRELLLGDPTGSRQAVAVADEEKLGYLGGEALRLLWPWSRGEPRPDSRPESS